MNVYDSVALYLYLPGPHHFLCLLPPFSKSMSQNSPDTQVQHVKVETRRLEQPQIKHIWKHCSDWWFEAIWNSIKSNFISSQKGLENKNMFQATNQCFDIIFALVPCCMSFRETEPISMTGLTLSADLGVGRFQYWTRTRETPEVAQRWITFHLFSIGNQKREKNKKQRMCPQNTCKSTVIFRISLSLALSPVPSRCQKDAMAPSAASTRPSKNSRTPWRGQGVS